MNRRQYICNLSSRKAKRRGGYRAKQLRFLERRHLRVPHTLVCIWDAYERYLEADPGLMDPLQQELSSMLDANATYDVSPSVNVEDGVDYSFAGQFKRTQDVQGVENVLQAIKTVWESARLPEIQEYIRNHSGDPSELKMAILIQEVPHRLVSGLALSRDPVTGALDTILETVPRSIAPPGQHGARPRRWVYRGDEWQVRPDEADVPEDVMIKVIKETQRVAQAYGRPVELDWVYDGTQVTYVQLREITSLSTHSIYSNRISREVFPGMIKPLVWSVNVPLVNGAWLWVLTELAGPNDIDPNELAKSFYYRAYFNMGTIGEVFILLGFPRDSIELLLGVGSDFQSKPSFRLTPKTLALLPRLVRFLWDKLRFARKIRSFLPNAQERYEAFDWNRVAHKTETELLAEIDRLFDVTQHAAYYNIVAQLEAGLYTQLLRRSLDRIGVPLESLDLKREAQWSDEFDPDSHLRALSSVFGQLDPHVQMQIRSERYQGLAQLPEAGALATGVDAFLQRFGHLSDSGTDFSVRPWREIPDEVVRMVAEYPDAAEQDSGKVAFSELDIPSLHRQLATPIFRRAQEYAYYREAVSWVYTRDTGLFRVYFLALGQHFVRRGILEGKDDIFHLRLREVREIVASQGTTDHYKDVVRQRKSEMERYQDIDLPAIIYGDHAPPVDVQVADVLKGMGTSIGEYTGSVRVVRGIHDFDKVQEGDVLAIPYSDVSWTPLFARAGAVIAESGGILSHSSIVAREYGIPAVVSVDGATRLPDGTLVTVDGYNGIVHTLRREQSRQGNSGLTPSRTAA